MRDPKSNAEVTIDWPHYEVHHGHMFKLDDVVACESATVKWLITTPDSTKYAHMVFDVVATGEVTVLITEGANRTTGDVLTLLNRNRVGSPITAALVVQRGATGGDTDGATTIRSIRTGDTGPNLNIIGTSRGQNEYVLKPNTKYVVSATTYAAVFVSLHLDWYEHYNIGYKMDYKTQEQRA